MQTHTSLSAQLTARERGITTALLGLGLITFAIDASNTTLILPQIMTSLRVEVFQIHWVLTGPGILRTVVTASTGWLSGWFGPRTLYLICLGSMTVGSLGSMLAWDWPSLIFFRMLSGAGGGLIPQISQAIFYQIFPPGQRGMALGFALMGWSIGPAFGPFMGGNLLEFASWRVVYGITLPLCGLGFILAWWLLPNLQRPERRRLDYYGVIIISIVISTLLIALSQGNREGWDSRYILTLFAIAGGAAVLWVVVQLCHPEPLVELRLFSSVPFIMAMIVMFFTTMTFRGTGPMVSVLLQRLMGFEPLLVAYVQMAPNLVYGAAVLIVGRLSDHVPAYVLVLTGLLMYAAGFLGYVGVSEVTTLSAITGFLMVRFIAEALVVSPNNLATLEALPENKVYMATALSGLLRSIANAVGTAVAAVVWDQRYNYHLQQYAEETPLDSFGFAGALASLQHTLQWSGEIAALIPSKTMALIRDRLVAEASTAAWQDFFWFNALVAIFCLFPALPFWRRRKYQAPSADQTATVSALSAGGSKGDPKS
jgi:DHA2 family multidrug resistance protein